MITIIHDSLHLKTTTWDDYESFCDLSVILNDTELFCEFFQKFYSDSLYILLRGDSTKFAQVTENFGSYTGETFEKLIPLFNKRIVVVDEDYEVRAVLDTSTNVFAVVDGIGLSSSKEIWLVGDRENMVTLPVCAELFGTFPREEYMTNFNLLDEDIEKIEELITRFEPDFLVQV